MTNSVHNLASTVAFLLALAGCGKDESSATTMGTSEGSSSDSSIGTSLEDSSSGTGNASTDPTTGTMTGSGAEERCLAWYDVQIEIARWFCQCDVSHGIYVSIEACLADAPNPSSCVCPLFGAAPETAALLGCYAMIDKMTVDCLGTVEVCGNPQQCFDSEAQGLLDCGELPPSLCEALFSECNDPGPNGECVPP